MKKSLLALVSAVILVSSSNAAIAKTDESLIPKEKAKSDAIQFLTESKDLYPQWKSLGELKLNDEQPLYDFDGNLNAYLFSVTDGKEPRGYIIESANANQPGLLEAATNGSHPYEGVKSGNGLYVGPSAFFSKVDNNNFINLLDKSKVEKKNLKSKGLYTKESFAKQAATTPKITTNASTLAASSRYIYNVADTYVSAPGYCVPTAEANIVDYWAEEKGYYNLKKEGSTNLAINNVVDRLIETMDATTTGGVGQHTAKSGSIEYWQNHGDYSLNVDAHMSSSYVWSDHVSSIDNYRPTMLWLYGHPVWTDHSVTGVGYQITSTGQQNLIVHAGWTHTYTDTIYAMNTSVVKGIITQYAN